MAPWEERDADYYASVGADRYQQSLDNRVLYRERPLVVPEKYPPNIKEAHPVSRRQTHNY